MSKAIQPSTPRVGKLHTARDVRKELARLYRAARTNAVAPADASRMAHILNIVLRSIEVSEVEARLDALERKL